MDDIKRQMLARMLLGQGMAGQAADSQKLNAMYQKANIQAQMNGQELPPFEEWIKTQTPTQM